MELSEPDFGTTVDLLVERGAERIFVHLHFLAAGFHVRESIPELIEAARARHPQLHFETSPPLGEDPRIPDIILGRLSAFDDSEAR
jgi:sirohydrochlorin ferrochelatase